MSHEGRLSEMKPAHCLAEVRGVDIQTAQGWTVKHYYSKVGRKLQEKRLQEGQKW